MAATIASPRQAGRPERVPPHASLRTLRLAVGLTLEELAARISHEVPELAVSRGTLSAIESGSRGVSAFMLRALESAYGIPEGSLTTDYEPKGEAAS